MSIHWYPGHMAQAKRVLADHVKLVDVIIELRDARVPMSSANPLLQQIIGAKPRIVVLAKADLAEPALTQQWLRYMAESQQLPVLGVNLKQDRKEARTLLPKIRAMATPYVPRSQAGRFNLRPVRTMVVGIPNVGKSTLINILAGRAVAKTGALPGVTRQKQWIKLGKDLELLDTPGILWPRLDDPAVARRLAAIGSIGQGGFEPVELAAWLLRYAATESPVLLERYRLSDLSLAGHELLEAVGRNRGCLMRGGQVDWDRAAEIVLADFRTGKMGRVTLEIPPLLRRGGGYE